MIRRRLGRVLLAAVSALVVLYMPYPGREHRLTSADFCIGEDLANLSIHFREGSALGLDTQFLGFLVVISPNPFNFTHDGSISAVDNGLNDDDDDLPQVGQIIMDDVCQTDHADFVSGHYDLVASIIPTSPAANQGCRIASPRINNQTIAGAEGAIKEISFVVFCLTEPVTGTSSGGAVASPAGVVQAPIAPAESGPVPVAPPVEFDIWAVGAEEILPVNGPASALARFNYDHATGDLWFFVTIYGVSPNLVSHAAIHTAAKGNTGPILHYISQNGFMQIEGVITLSTHEAADLLAGNLYLSIASTPAGVGIARGQIIVPGQIGP